MKSLKEKKNHGLNMSMASLQILSQERYKKDENLLENTSKAITCFRTSRRKGKRLTSAANTLAASFAMTKDSIMKNLEKLIWITEDIFHDDSGNK